jgi:hypothetical protein
MQGGDQVLAGVHFVFNSYVHGADFVLDVEAPFSALSREYEPSKRVFVHTEPSKSTDYIKFSPTEFSQWYPRLILSHHDQLRKFPQTRPIRMGGKWVQPDDSMRKEFGLGGFVSFKRDPRYEGYAFRQMVLDNQNSINIPGVIYNSGKSWRGQSHEYPVYSKDVVSKYMFHLCIENARESYWATEKLIDTLAVCSVPLYYGDPDIFDEFDPRGFILITPENVIQTINALTPDDYGSRKEAVLANYEKSKRYWNVLENWACELKKSV